LTLDRAEEAQEWLDRAEAVAQQQKADPDAALRSFLDELRSELQRKKTGVAP
jgi:hypothetical protein